MKIFKTSSSKYTVLASEALWIVFLIVYILNLLGKNWLPPLTTRFGASIVIGVTTVLLAFETYLEGSKSIKLRFREMSTIMQTIVIVISSVYALYLGFVAQELSPMLNGVIILDLIFEAVFLIKEFFLDWSD